MNQKKSFEVLKRVKRTRWLAIIVLYTVLTMLSVYFVSGNSPLFVVRYLLSFVFVAFLPGYCLVNILFIGVNRIDLVENVVLSVALSFGITGLVGLFLGLSPIGINFTSITVSLSAIVLGLGLVAFVRKNREPTAIKPTETVGHGKA
ncbi:DUF1616 domain-containing protein [Candidatus Bathyarchaeota archaeon]|nr:DUF1616 domain-containing protein [Candidatus Bathyarchaeota archaeon]